MPKTRKLLRNAEEHGEGLRGVHLAERGGQTVVGVRDAGQGLSREALCEALAMATYMGGGPSYAYSAKALAAFDTFSAEEGAA